MALNKKYVIPLVIILLAIAAGGGWFVWQHTPGQKGAEVKQLYTCSMHSFIIKDKPGLCPICGMELIKKIDSTVKAVGKPADQKQPADMHEHVTLSDKQRIMANVATVEAKNETLNKEINAVGIVQYNQSRQAKVTAWIAGRLEKLNVNSVGAFVEKSYQ